MASRGRVDSERLHQKGCHCKKSNCLKNYCECYEVKNLVAIVLSRIEVNVPFLLEEVFLSNLRESVFEINKFEIRLITIYIYIYSEKEWRERLCPLCKISQCAHFRFCAELAF